MSGGNKRRRKKCRWNICHLGINVVQSIVGTYFPNYLHKITRKQEEKIHSHNKYRHNRVLESCFFMNK